MATTKTNLTRRFDWVLLLIVIVSALLIILDIGKNLLAEIESTKNNTLIRPVNSIHQVNKEDAQKSFDDWLDKTSGGRVVKD
jgi:hypothetical protein